jgi:hypothetical protein
MNPGKKIFATPEKMKTRWIGWDAEQNWRLEPAGLQSERSGLLFAALFPSGPQNQF